MNFFLSKTSFVKRATSIIVAILILTACSSRGPVTTEDNSAEYKNVRELPPLKKPDVSGGLVNAETDSNADTNNQSANNIETTIATTRSGVVQLRIEANPDAAWMFVSENLRKSSITVHTRNRSARRFDIGCNDSDDIEARGRSVGRRIFSRNSKQTQYCAIELRKQGRLTIAKIIDRNGDDFDETSAKALFTRIVRK